MSPSCIAAFLLVLAGSTSPCDSTKTDDLTACAATELKSEEATLADVISRALAILAEMDRLTRETYGPNPPPDLERKGTEMLDAEQAAWLRYRDASCERRTYENLGGRERPIYVLACRTLLTRERVDELRRDFNLAPPKPTSP